MSTLRERHNQILKDEIDRFAARMKEWVDDRESHLQGFERMNADLMGEIERLEADQQVSQ